MPKFSLKTLLRDRRVLIDALADFHSGKFENLTEENRIQLATSLRARIKQVDDEIRKLS